MTYNIREGAGQPGLREKLVRYIQEQDVDILALQELNGWDEALLQTYALQWGHPYAVFLRADTGYHLGLTARLPFDVIRTRHQGFWHGMIHVRFLPGPETIPGWTASESVGEEEFDDQNDEDDERYYTENDLLSVLEQDSHLIK